MHRLGAVALGLLILGGASCKDARDWAHDRVEQRTQEAHAREEKLKARPPTPAPRGPGLAAGRYRLVELQVEVDPVDRRGKAWDPPAEPLPDLRVEVRIDGVEVARCDAGRESLRGRCRLAHAFGLDAATRVELVVIDRDDLVDDPVGAATLGDPSVWGTDMLLRMQPTEEVRAASIVLEAVPTWWALHRARLIGLGAGVGFALVIVGGFRRRLLAPDPEPPPPPRCAHCGKVVMSVTTPCMHCGATP